MSKKKTKLKVKQSELAIHQQLAQEQRKEVYKKQKGTRGKPYNQDELKKRISLTLTPTAGDILTAVARETGLSRSEWFERYLRSLRKTVHDTVIKNNEKVE